jgi:hypothetical protein
MLEVINSSKEYTIPRVDPFSICLFNSNEISIAIWNNVWSINSGDCTKILIFDSNSLFNLQSMWEYDLQPVDLIKILGLVILKMNVDNPYVARLKLAMKIIGCVKIN